MKRIIRFSRFFLPAMIVSGILTLAGIIGYITLGGFNLGVDFQAGLIQEVQLAPAAFSLTWSGRGSATFLYDRGGLHINLAGQGTEGKTVDFPFSEYRTAGALAQAMNSQVEGLNAELKAREDTNPQFLVFSTQGNPYLGSAP
jgi:preprotein translocase subunit SecF